MDAIEEARVNALTKIFNAIAETGTVTDNQLKFIEMMKKPKDKFSDIEKMAKIVTPLMEVMGK